MKIKYGAEIKKEAILANLKRITNQIYKLLPAREEDLDWQSLLKTLIEELAGMDQILFDQHENLFPLLCKLEGLLKYNNEDDFFQYRRTIFECLNLMGVLTKNVSER